ITGTRTPSGWIRTCVLSRHTFCPISLVFVISGQANAEMGGYVSVSFELGAWLYILAGIASIAVGVLDMIKSK
ncbi:hypothetical protein, partial [Enorma massiliensis]|uniref:hypothetical protein n=1 Tax=Enorma massiliensis TaxID=1472761 RepID=UPI0034A508FE